MTMFRVEEGNRFEGPHQSNPAVTYGTPVGEADAAMIMVHGRGAGARSMIPLAEEFSRPGFHYLLPQADNHTWYPFSFLSPKEKNQPGISSGLQVIHDCIASLEDEGIPKNKIMLLGFSQGACLASEYAARHPSRYGGMAVLSGGLIGEKIDKDQYFGDLEGTPVFLGCSDVDPHIPVERVEVTGKVLSALNGNVDKRIYKGMAHTVNEDEIQAVRLLMAKMLERD